MYIPNDDTNIITSVGLWLKRLDNEINEPKNQNSKKLPKVVKPTNNKTFGTSVINIPMSPSSLEFVLLLFSPHNLFVGDFM